MKPSPPAPAFLPRLDFHPYRATFVLPTTVLDEDGWQTFENGSAEGSPPGVQALFAVPGVASVSLHRDRVVLLRDPAVSWEEVLPGVQAALEQGFVRPGTVKRPKPPPG